MCDCEGGAGESEKKEKNPAAKKKKKTGAAEQRECCRRRVEREGKRRRRKRTEGEENGELFTQRQPATLDSQRERERHRPFFISVFLFRLWLLSLLFFFFSFSCLLWLELLQLLVVSDFFFHPDFVAELCVLRITARTFSFPQLPSEKTPVVSRSASSCSFLSFSRLFISFFLSLAFSSFFLSRKTSTTTARRFSFLAFSFAPPLSLARKVDEDLLSLPPSFLRVPRVSL